VARPDPQTGAPRFCPDGGFAPQLASAIPPRPCQRALYDLWVGCNRIGCRECGQLAVRDAASARYRCGCRETYLETVWLARQPMEVGSPTPVPWECQGHPPATRADLEALGFTGELLADVDAALYQHPHPPYLPQGHYGYGADERLDLEPSYDEEAVRERLIAALDSTDDRATLRAMHVLDRHDWLPLQGALFRWSGLSQRRDPQDAFFDLGHTWQSMLVAKAKRDGAGSEALHEAQRIYDAAPDKASRSLRKLLGR
jgi:hypothetical protein